MNDRYSEDNLEKFLRKHLDGHTEEPSENLWQKIEAGIPTSHPAPWFVRYKFYAAAAIFVLGLAVQHVYFHSKIIALQSQIGQLQQQNSGSPAEIIPADTLYLAKKAQEIATKTLPEGVTGVSNPLSVLPSASTNFYPTSGRELENKRPPSESKTNTRENQSNLPSESVNGEPIATLDPVKKTTELTQATGTFNNPGQEIPAFTDSIKENEEFSHLPGLSLPKYAFSNKNIVLPVFLVPSELITPVKTHRFSIGAVAMPIRVKQDISVDEGKIKFPGPDRKRIRPATEATGYRAGLIATAALSKNLGITTGILYRYQTQENIHRTRLEVQDGDHHLLPHGGPDDLEFNYTAYDGGGLSEVELRVQPSSSHSTNFPPDRPVPFDLTVQHTQAYIEVPIGLQYAYRFGRWQPFARAGVQLGFLTHEESGIKNLRLKTTDFEIIPDSRPSIQTQPTNPINASLWASAGFQWSLTKQLGISVEGWYTQQIGKEQVSRESTRKELTLGGGLGIHYHF